MAERKSLEARPEFIPDYMVSSQLGPSFLFVHVFILKLLFFTGSLGSLSILSAPLCPTYWSSTMLHFHTPSISKIKFLLRSARPWSLFLGWPYSLHPSFSVKFEVMPNYTTIHQTNLSPFTTSYSSHYLSSLQISSSTGYIGACIIQRFTRPSINHIINGSSQPLLQATHSIHWMGLRKACHITCTPIFSLFKSLLILRFSFSSTYGLFLFVSLVLSLARVKPPPPWAESFLYRWRWIRCEISHHQRRCLPHDAPSLLQL